MRSRVLSVVRSVVFPERGDRVRLAGPAERIGIEAVLASRQGFEESSMPIADGSRWFDAAFA